MNIFELVENLTAKKNITDDHIENAEIKVKMDFKLLIAKTDLDPELTSVRISVRREFRETILFGY